LQREKSKKMVLKLFKAGWFVSLLAVLTVFMLVYASLQETLIVRGGEEEVVISREVFFYAVLVILALINVVVFIFMKLYKKGHEDFLSWLFGLILVMNIFFIIALNFIYLYNSNEKYEYSRLGLVIYGSVALILIWTISWPLYSVSRKFLTKANA
jgi:hypothetical protein